MSSLVPSNLGERHLCCDKNQLHQLTAESICVTQFHSICLDAPANPSAVKNPLVDFLEQM
jgi:hypothetical protein